MKRLSLITFTILLILGCQRSNANPMDPTLRDSRGNEDASGYTRLTSCYEGDEWVCAVEAAIAAKTNQKRAGLVKLEHSFETSFAARVHSLKMMKDGKIHHEGFKYERDKPLKSEFPGFPFDYFKAENVASMSSYFGEGPEAVAEEFVSMWWNSEGHRKNILHSEAMFLGVGVARSENTIYATQVFH